MSKRALIYVVASIGLSVAISGQSLFIRAPLATQWILLLVLITLTTVAHLFITDTLSHEAWAINLVFLFTGVLLLDSFDFVLLVIVPHSIEWIYEVWIRKSTRLRNWYIQPFNIATHIISGFIARAFFLALSPDLAALASLTGCIAASVAMMVYLLVNHALIGGVLVLVRGVTLRQSGVFERGNLLNDFLQFALGYVVAVLWLVNPILILPATAPLVLIYRAIQVPKLAKEAQTDAKTGLLNMRHFNERFSAELDRAARFSRPLAVVMADLDLLRNVNNTYGHLAGDVVLTGIGEIIRHNVRAYDIAARFGGEEFSIVLLEAGGEDARTFANRLRQAIESTEFVIPTSPQPIHVTMSLGVASFPTDAVTQDDLIHLADVAVYRAKLQGRNCVVCTSDIPRSIAPDTSEIEPAAGAYPYHAAYTAHTTTVVATPDSAGRVSTP
jgi:diguanylate cyclase (GGDEF)-like protein